MKFFNFCFALVIFCAVFQLDSCENLNCQFQDDSIFMGYYQTTTFYTCKVTSLVNTNNDQVINGYSGNHEENKNYSLVKGVWIHDTNTIFIPSGIGFVFNLTSLTMWNTQLVEIKSQDFIGMEDLEELHLPDNRLTTLPIDVFSTLAKLKILDLLYNQLEELQNGVFGNNLQLVKIHLQQNKIKFLGSNLFYGLTKINFVGLSDNICIDEVYRGTSEIIEMKDDISLKCQNTNAIPTMNPIEKLFIEIKEQFTRITNELITEFTTATEEHQDKIIESLTKAKENEELMYHVSDWQPRVNKWDVSKNNGKWEFTKNYKK